MSMTFSDHFLTNLADFIFSELERQGKMNGGHFKDEDFKRIERECMAKKIDEMDFENKILWSRIEALEKK